MKNITNEKLTMNNETRKGKKITCLSLFTFLFSLFLFAGCINPFDSPQMAPKGTSGGIGTITVSVDGENAARTIQPTTIQSSFQQYKLEFDCTSGGATKEPLYRTNATLRDPIEMPVGTWTITVTAYIVWQADDEDFQLPAAKGFAEGVVISEGQNDPVGVDLEAIADEGEGTFSWTITYPDNVTGTMTITPLTDGTDEDTLTLEGTPATDPEYEDKYVVSTGSVRLESGSYRVVFNMKLFNRETDAEEAEIERREILQVYQNLDSPFTAIFREQFFNITKVGNIDLPNKIVDTNVELPLIATVEPVGATFNKIVWSVKDANGTEAEIRDNSIFFATNAVKTTNSKATITATIEHGKGYEMPYTQNFEITVKYVEISGMVRISFATTPFRTAVNDQESVELIVRIDPEEATNKNVTVLVQPADPTSGAALAAGTGRATYVNNGPYKTFIGDEEVIYTKVTVTGTTPGTVRVTLTSVDDPDTSRYFIVDVRHVPVESITLNIDEITMPYGIAPATLIPLIKPLNATNKKVTWETVGNQTALSVGKDSGTVTILQNTTTTIWIKAICDDDPDNMFAYCTIEVVPSGGSSIPVTEVKLNTAKLNLIKGDTVDLTAILAPFLSTDKTMMWKSSDPDVVTVPDEENEGEGNGEPNTANGTVSIPVSAVGPGSAIVIGTAQSGGATAQCVVTVEDAAVGTPVTGVTLNTPTLNLNAGTSADLIASVLPTKAGNKKVTWTSSNTLAAGVDETGKVTAGTIPGAKATIMVTTEDNGKTAVCEVTVVPADTIKVSGVELNLTTLRFIEMAGVTENLFATVLPADADDTTVVWSTNDPDVATVDPVTGKINSKNPGTAIITATTVDGGKQADCEVIVRAYEAGYIHGLTLSETSIQKDYKTTWQLNPIFTVTPTGSDPAYPKLLWLSSDPSIASVDQNGLVTMVFPKKPDPTATITVYSEDGGCKATCVVTVLKVDVTHVRLNIAVPSSPATGRLSLANNGRATLTAIVYPWNATYREVKWSSDDPEAATIEEDGNGSPNENGESTGTVIGKSNGTVTITVASDDDPSKTASCVIQVRSPTIGTEVEKVTLNTYELELEKTKTATLIASTQSSVADSAFVWFSDNPDVADVGLSTGLVTAKEKEGTANVYATSVKGGIMSQACVVTVRTASAEILPPENVELNISGITMRTTASYNTANLVAVLQPRDADNKPLAANTKVVWSSNNSAVAEVNYTTGLITAKTNGTATITATAVDGGETKGGTVEVQAIAVPVTDNKLNMARLTLKMGGTRADWATRDMIATLTPAAPTNGNIFWYSTNPQVATVDQNGKVDRVKAGTAIVYATAASSGKYAEAPVDILETNSSLNPVVTVSVNDLTLLDEQGTTTFTVYARNPSESVVPTGVTWSLNDPSVATVDAVTGVITPRKPGSTIIYATTLDGAKMGGGTVKVLYATATRDPRYQYDKMGTTQVTQELWQYVMTGNNNNISATPSKSALPARDGEIQELRPVDSISWFAALVFCNRLSVLKGLTPVYSIRNTTDTTQWGNVPTNAPSGSNADSIAWNRVTVLEGNNINYGYKIPSINHWRIYLSGGASYSYYYFYRTSGTGSATGSTTWSDNYGWVLGGTNVEVKTHQVGLKWPNGYDLYDMAGNVRELLWNTTDADGFKTYANGALDTFSGGNSNFSYRRLGGGSYRYNSTYAIPFSYRDIDNDLLWEYDSSAAVLRRAHVTESHSSGQIDIGLRVARQGWY
jgi:uncharacterized protein YjdB